MIGSLPVFGGGRFSGVRVVVEVALVGLSPVGGFAVTNLTRHGHRLGVSRSSSSAPREVNNRSSGRPQLLARWVSVMSLNGQKNLMRIIPVSLGSSRWLGSRGW